MTISAILLAAGESTRMGRPKALLPWAGRALIEWQAEQLLAAGAAEVVVVLGHEAAALRPAVPSGRTRVVVNDAYQEGRASSLRAGAAAVEDDVQAVIVLGVDQPRPGSVSRRLLDAWREGGALVVVPSHRGRRGHPVVLSGTLLPELRRVTEQELGLRGVVGRHADSVREVAFESDIIAVDLNTPLDYETALRRPEYGL